MSGFTTLIQDGVRSDVVRLLLRHAPRHEHCCHRAVLALEKAWAANPVLAQSLFLNELGPAIQSIDLSEAFRENPDFLGGALEAIEHTSLGTSTITTYAELLPLLAAARLRKCGLRVDLSLPFKGSKLGRADLFARSGDISRPGYQPTSFATSPGGIAVPGISFESKALSGTSKHTVLNRIKEGAGQLEKWQGGVLILDVSMRAKNRAIMANRLKPYELHAIVEETIRDEFATAVRAFESLPCTTSKNLAAILLSCRLSSAKKEDLNDQEYASVGTVWRWGVFINSAFVLANRWPVHPGPFFRFLSATICAGIDRSDSGRIDGAPTVLKGHQSITPWVDPNRNWYTIRN